MNQPKYYKNQLTLADFGIKDKRKKITPEILAQMKQLREQKVTYKKIADKFNISYNCVYLNLNNDYYNNHFKKIQQKYVKNCNPEVKERMKQRIKEYNKKRRQLFNEMDYKKYLTSLPPRNTIKNQILNILIEDRSYKYSELKQKLNKDYDYFSRALRQLEQEGKVRLGGKTGNKIVQKVNI